MDCMGGKPSPLDTPRSEHIIDLRTSGAKPAVEAVQHKPVPAPRQAPRQAPRRAPEPAPEPQFEYEPQDGGVDVISSPAGKRRFWPAFGKFLLLLILLGIVIAGGFYLYMTYYNQG